jgi:hypothetical protein
MIKPDLSIAFNYMDVIWILLLILNAEIKYNIKK